MYYIVCRLSLLKAHISYIFLKKIQVFFKLLEKNLTWNFKFKSSQVLLQQVQVRSSSSSAWPETSSQVKFEHFQVFWTLYLSWWLGSEVWWVYQLTSICLSSAQLKESTDRKCTAHTYCTYVFLVSKARFGLSFFSYNVQNWNITKALTKYERPKMKRDALPKWEKRLHLFSFSAVRKSKWDQCNCD